MLARAQQGLGHGDAVALLLDRLDRRAGGDAAQHGQGERVVGGCIVDLSRLWPRRRRPGSRAGDRGLLG